MPSILSKESTIANRPQWYLTYNITGRIVPLVQNGQPMRHDGADNRLIEVKIKYEGISGKYDSKFQLNENEFFQLDDLSGYGRGIISVLVYL
ncbi:MAG: hypothetical protein M3Y53_02445 [Thermoproteota archaeon]|nr:hypothetical protein [Thermoproteota archaeon]